MFLARKWETLEGSLHLFIMPPPSFSSPSGFGFSERDWPAERQREAFLHHDPLREGEPQVALFCLSRTDCCFLHPLLSRVQSRDLSLLFCRFYRTKTTIDRLVQHLCPSAL